MTGGVGGWGWLVDGVDGWFLLRLKISRADQFEKIKDGCATLLEYNGRIEKFKTPNILIVFANRKPNIEKLSKDRWIILKISKDFSKLIEITCESSMVKNKKKKIENESDDKVSQPRKLCPEEEPRTRFIMTRRFETSRRTNLFLIQQFDINCF